MSLDHFEEDDASPKQIPQEKLMLVGNQARKVVELEQEILAIEAQLEEKEKTLNSIQGKVLPELLSECGISDFTLEDGSKVSVADTYSSTISAPNKEAAFKWMEDNGFAPLIKRYIQIPITKTEGEDYEELCKLLTRMDIDFTTEGDIHWQTLQSFVKGQFEAPPEDPAVKPPVALFGIYIAKKATVKTKTKNKTRKYKKK